MPTVKLELRVRDVQGSGGGGGCAQTPLPDAHSQKLRLHRPGWRTLHWEGLVACRGASAHGRHLDGDAGRRAVVGQVGVQAGGEPRVHATLEARRQVAGTDVQHSRLVRGPLVVCAHLGVAPPPTQSQRKQVLWNRSYGRSMRAAIGAAARSWSSPITSQGGKLDINSPGRRLAQTNQACMIVQEEPIAQSTQAAIASLEVVSRELCTGTPSSKDNSPKATRAGESPSLCERSHRSPNQCRLSGSRIKLIYKSTSGSKRASFRCPCHYVLRTTTQENIGFGWASGAERAPVRTPGGCDP